MGKFLDESNFDPSVKGQVLALERVLQSLEQRVNQELTEQAIAASTGGTKKFETKDFQDIIGKVDGLLIGNKNLRALMLRENSDAAKASVETIRRLSDQVTKSIESMLQQLKEDANLKDRADEVDKIDTKTKTSKTFEQLDRVEGMDLEGNLEEQAKSAQDKAAEVQREQQQLDVFKKIDEEYAKKGQHYVDVDPKDTQKPKRTFMQIDKDNLESNFNALDPKSIAAKSILGSRVENGMEGFTDGVKDIRESLATSGSFDQKKATELSKYAYSFLSMPNLDPSVKKAVEDLKASIASKDRRAMFAALKVVEGIGLDGLKTGAKLDDYKKDLREETKKVIEGSDILKFAPEIRKEFEDMLAKAETDPDGKVFDVVKKIATVVHGRDLQDKLKGPLGFPIALTTVPGTTYEQKIAAYEKDLEAREAKAKKSKDLYEARAKYTGRDESGFQRGERPKFQLDLGGETKEFDLKIDRGDVEEEIDLRDKDRMPFEDREKLADKIYESLEINERIKIEERNLPAEIKRPRTEALRSFFVHNVLGLFNKDLKTRYEMQLEGHAKEQIREQLAEANDKARDQERDVDAPAREEKQNAWELNKAAREAATKAARAAVINGMGAKDDKKIAQDAREAGQKAAAEQKHKQDHDDLSL